MFNGENMVLKLQNKVYLYLYEKYCICRKTAGIEIGNIYVAVMIMLKREGTGLIK